MHKNKINNKAYIGQTKQGIKTRWKKHVFDSGNLKSKDYNSYFHKAIRKYSISNWESKIIEQNIDNIDDANSKEIFWIAMFKTNESDFGYNSNSGGKHCLLTSNVIEKIKKSNSGKKRSEETKKKISQALSGRKQTRHHIDKRISKYKGIPLSIETKQKISTSHLSRTRSDSENLKSYGTKRKNASSKYIGVCYVKYRNKWCARIAFNKKEITIGYFNTELNAAHAYDLKAKELYHDKAILNFKDNNDNDSK